MRGRVVALIVTAVGVALAAGLAMTSSNQLTVADKAAGSSDRADQTTPPARTAIKTPWLPPAHSRTWLLPNLQSLPAEDVLIEVLDSQQRRLRFTSIIANTGIGPVETLPDDAASCPSDQRHASQVIYHDADGDGQFDRDTDITTTVKPAGCMLDHPDHDHWHFDAAARYTLTEPESVEPIVSADKVSFCWRDNREVPTEASVGLGRFYPVEDECGYGDVQGITPGWADVYDTELADQHLDLPDDIPNGTYCLWNEADPYHLLEETDATDNAAVAGIEIDGTEVGPAQTSECAVPTAPELTH